jgi:V/A-type H+-transporting ATPase subunit C
VVEDIGGFMIPGGNNPPEQYVRIAETEDREMFISLIKQTSQFPVYSRALKRLTPGNPISDEEAAERTWERWRLKKTPAHQVEIAVATILLDQMEGISKRHAFSVLPILVYFERKRYEIANIRAIARGKQHGMPNDFIMRYLVL